MTRISCNPQWQPSVYDPLYLFMDWLAARFGEGGNYAAFRLNGITVVAGRGGTAAELESLVYGHGGFFQEFPAGRADDPRGEGVAA